MNDFSNDRKGSSPAPLAPPDPRLNRDPRNPRGTVLTLHPAPLRPGSHRRHKPELRRSLGGPGRHLPVWSQASPSSAPKSPSMDTEQDCGKPGKETHSRVTTVGQRARPV